MNNKYLSAVLALTGTILLSSAAHAQHKAHVHGISNMDIVLEDTTLSIDLRSPLANLIHFEHAPHNEAETEAVRKMAATLRDTHGTFDLPAEAQCTLQSVRLSAGHIDPALLGEKTAAHTHEATHDHGHGHEHDHQHEHMDLDGEYVYQCKKPENLSYIDVRLLASFPATERINVQAVTPKRQLSATLTSSASRIQLK